MNPGSNPVEQQLAEARRENEELKRALAELQRTIAVTNASTAEMEHLIYALSHDFRQPLRTMGSYAQLLDRQYAGNADAAEMTGFIINGANEMRSLIEDVLKYSRIKSAPPRTMVELSAVVQWAAGNVQNRVRETRAEIKWGELPAVLINESQFVQLFEELFTNALKFRSSEQPRINVDVTEEGEDCLISVGDNGIGIESQYHETIFAPFKRLHGKEIPGSGLGLAICRKIVRAHGGKIWVESDGQHRSTFRFSIPAT